MERDLVARLEENERAFATAKQEQEFAFQTRKNEMEANLVSEAGTRCAKAPKRQRDG